MKVEKNDGKHKLGKQESKSYYFIPLFALLVDLFSVYAFSLSLPLYLFLPHSFIFLSLQLSRTPLSNSMVKAGLTSAPVCICLPNCLANGVLVQASRRSYV